MDLRLKTSNNTLKNLIFLVYLGESQEQDILVFRIDYLSFDGLLKHFKKSENNRLKTTNQNMHCFKLS